MRKKMLILTIFMFLTLSSKISASANITPLDAKVYLNGEAINFSVPLITYNGRTLVPMREIFEKLGANVEWVNDEQKIVSTTRTKTMEMWIDNAMVVCNNIEIFTDVPPILYQNKTLVPLRFVGEQMNLNVVWDDTTKTIKMDSIGDVNIGSVSQTFWDEFNNYEIHKKYTGELLNGVPTGVGTMQHTIIKKDKNIFSIRKGCFNNWMENGWVSMEDADGVSTCGFYNEGVPYGDFLVVFPSGARWFGTVVDIGEEMCIPHGKGIYNFYDGAKYICNIEYGSMNGYGELYSPEGVLLYAGDHKDGVSHGYGKMYDEDGSLVYDGEFKNGVFSGQGNLYDKNGFLVYSGTFPIKNNTYNYNDVEAPSFVDEWKQFDSSLEERIESPKKTFDVNLYNSSEAKKIYKKYNLDTSWIIDGVLIGYDSFKGASARTEYEKQEYKKYQEKYEYHKIYVPIANDEVKAKFGY